MKEPALWLRNKNYLWFKKNDSSLERGRKSAIRVMPMGVNSNAESSLFSKHTLIEFEYWRSDRKNLLSDRKLFCEAGWWKSTKWNSVLTDRASSRCSVWTGTFWCIEEVGAPGEKIRKLNSANHHHLGKQNVVVNWGFISIINFLFCKHRTSLDGFRGRF